MVGAYYLLVALKERIQQYGVEVIFFFSSLSFFFFFFSFSHPFRIPFALKDVGGSMVPLVSLSPVFVIPSTQSFLIQVPSLKK